MFPIDILIYQLVGLGTGLEILPEHPNVGVMFLLF